MPTVAQPSRTGPRIARPVALPPIGRQDKGRAGHKNPVLAWLARIFRPSTGPETLSAHLLKDIGLTPRDIGKPNTDVRPAGLDSRL